MVGGSRRPSMGETWSRKKKDDADRGVYLHRKGLWAVRFICGARCPYPHKEVIGPVKRDATLTLYARKARAKQEPVWCPRAEREQAKTAAKAKRVREAQRVTFAQYSDDYLAWCQQTDASGQVRKRSWRSIKSEQTRL